MSASDTSETHDQHDPDDESIKATLERKSVKPSVFFPALILLLVVVGLSMAFPVRTGEVFGTLNDAVIGSVGWYYTLSVTGFVIFSLWMAIGRFGDLTLGPDDEGPEYGFFVWFSMLFAAGMGIGLVFWGAAEPLSFYVDPKPGWSGDDADIAHLSMAQTFLHWGVHAWAIYVVVGLALAYAIHRRGRSISLRWTLEPLLGDRVKGWVGDLIDVVAIVGTIAGVATSLGLGVSQISAGLVYLDVVDEATDPLMVALIVAITAIATISVVTGLDIGIKILSNFNIALAGVFAVVLLILGPTLFLLRSFVENIGAYLFEVIPLSFSTSAFFGEDGEAWQGAWTTFYWGWWISWAPFVGLFIARISRGRTVREFVFGVLLVPTLVSMVWFSILGGSALYQQIFGGGGLTNDDGTVTSENVLFNLVGDLPGGTLLVGIVILLVTIFFVTSSDSGSLVVDMLASGGDTNPPKWSRVMWAVIEGSVAIGLLLAGSRATDDPLDALGALQTGAILTAAPFSVIMIAMCFALYKVFKSEYREIQRLNRKARVRAMQDELGDAMTEQVTDHLVENFDDHFGEHVDSHVETALDRRSRWRRPLSRRSAGPDDPQE
ncbi:choline/glycine/proline betaine transport protein [Mumia flava]|uniref:Choline/glycine/proline betaine transport protein n=1 Tax=Mumia flava TaxID=1348852 RepID=A0A0B2BBW8_9ACTN|nr:BCCT family transporter [Mumia flava]PJJ53964.1 choline/glycine/proline betaine transport protein [Mumia flava]